MKVSHNFHRRKIGTTIRPSKRPEKMQLYPTGNLDRTS